ncbi:hypothetical protein OAM89_00420 [bacterium]|jgi:hypothetical protein|nr:hypothetical protein [bacterium]|tara:strand:- start:2295 stop:2555 length:261 start_codon:yes stop_codon:yes gene_type:complete
MTDKKNSTINNILEYAFKNKLNTSITGVVYLLIYKVIDMNTMQWFGDDIFIRNGNLLEFIVVAAVMGSFVIIAIAIIADALRGKLF